MLPDYPQQVQQTYRNLASQCEVTRADWQDNVGKRFFENYINRYKEDIDFYIKELNNTLIAIDKCQNEMAALCGIDISSVDMPEVYDRYGNRKDWNESYDGPAPGNLDAPEVKRIMNERKRNI